MYNVDILIDGALSKYIQLEEILITMPCYISDSLLHNKKRFKNLLYCSCNILGISCGHCLNSYGMFTADSHIAYHHRIGFSPYGLVCGFTIFLPRNYIKRIIDNLHTYIYLCFSSQTNSGLQTKLLCQNCNLYLVNLVG